MSNNRAGRKRNGHRSKPRRFSSARVYGTLNGWTHWMRIHGIYDKAASPEWEEEIEDQDWLEQGFTSSP